MTAAPPVVLALETSCDETAAALFQRGKGLLASGIASQTALHEVYGGVVPEVASRNHLAALPGLIRQTLRSAGLERDAIGAFAATSGPGLASSLMIGVAAAKAMALSCRKPYMGINHLEGHLLSPFFTRQEVSPSVGLIVSGGHTLLVDVAGFGQYRILGRTVDDAAGEAFDKVARLLGLAYPGGPEIDRLAGEGNPAAHRFPRPMIHSGDFQFSFSGIKTSVRYLLPKLHAGQTADVCASFQEAVVEVLVEKTIKAAHFAGRRLVTMSGGVSCNRRLRARMREAAGQAGLDLLIAEPGLSTDNAAMIASVAAERFELGIFSSMDEDIDPNLPLIRAGASAGGAA